MTERTQRRRQPRIWAMVFAAVAVLAALAAPHPSVSAEPGSAEPITPEILETVSPGAERAGAITGNPPAAPIYAGGKIVGYAFSTFDVVGSVGYSGKPIDIVAAVDSGSTITGAYLRAHSEPILVIGVADEQLKAYVDAFRSFDLRGRVTEADSSGGRLPDAISGATVSSAVIRDAVLRAGRAVARSRGLLGRAESGARLDRESFETAAWTELVDDGSIVHARISRGAMAGRLGEPVPDRPEDTFIELHAALASPPRIGQNLLGTATFNRLTAGMGVDDQAVVIAANGLYSFKGTAFRRSGIFDRIQIAQGERTIRLTRDGYRNVEVLRVGGAPEFREIGVFVIPGDTGFDPLKPWRLDLLVRRDTAGGGVVNGVFSLDYALPGRYRIATEPDAEETLIAAGPDLWMQIWRERWPAIAAATLMLVVLGALLVLQEPYVRRHHLYRSVRRAYLAITLI